VAPSDSSAAAGDGCHDRYVPDALHLVYIGREDVPGTTGVMINVGPDDEAVAERRPRVGERYVVFDETGWSGIVEVASPCSLRTPDRLSRPVADAGGWGNVFMGRPVVGCSLRWIAVAPRMSALTRRDDFSAMAVGPTRERWEHLRTMLFDEIPPPCPVEPGVICNTPTRSPPAEWETTLAVDLDGDGSADLETRQRNCQHVGGIGYDVRVRDGRNWNSVQSWVWRAAY
jgi:hypothetical protein